MNMQEVIKWLEYDLNENKEIKKELTKAAAIEKTDKVIMALEKAIDKLKG